MVHWRAGVFNRRRCAAGCRGGGSGCVFQGDVVVEGLQLGDEAVGFAVGIGPAAYTFVIRDMQRGTMPGYLQLTGPTGRSAH
jgi:hypothetical protein